jgi:hypothetical protein
MLAGITNQLNPTVNPQLVRYIGTMSFHRANTDIQLLPDLPVGIALDDQFENFRFAGCQRFVPMSIAAPFVPVIAA